MKYYFPIHLDGGNRGCEAIAKGSAMLTGEPKDNLFGYCRDIQLDTSLGVDRYLTLIPCRRESMFIDKVLGALNKLLHTRKTAELRQLYPYHSFLRIIEPDGIVISGGGDMLCYDNNEVIYTNNWLHQRGIKTILWGCSMGPENQTPEKLETLRNFSLIYARESLTYEYFKSLNLPNVCLFPDPAFILQPEECTLPMCFSNGEVIGMNISNYVMGGITLKSKFGAEVLNLISYILDNTNKHILLIPHVTWNNPGVNQDDREIAKLITEHFDSPERLYTLDIENLNYCQIRNIISHCRMFIGARTHAVISAYSTCVPTIALGYSIKSRGIARDLGLDESLVVNSKQFDKGDLMRSFLNLCKNEKSIKQHLTNVMPEYKKRTYQIRQYLENLETLH